VLSVVLFIGFAVKALGHKKTLNKKALEPLQFEGVITENNGSVQEGFDYLGVEETIGCTCRPSSTLRSGRMQRAVSAVM
jgi:hypothetical protein